MVSKMTGNVVHDDIFALACFMVTMIKRTLSRLNMSPSGQIN